MQPSQWRRNLAAHGLQIPAVTLTDSHLLFDHKLEITSHSTSSMKRTLTRARGLFFSSKYDMILLPWLQRSTSYVSEPLANS